MVQFQAPQFPFISQVKATACPVYSAQQLKQLKAYMRLLKAYMRQLKAYMRLLKAYMRLLKAYMRQLKAYMRLLACSYIWNDRQAILTLCQL